jgi:hypothetical protein
MKLSDYLDAFYEYSDKASLLSRQLAFAGIAVVWLFKSGDGVNFQLPASLIYPLLLLVLAFIFDLLQYLVGACIWYFFHRFHEKRMKSSNKDSSLLASHWYSKFIALFFCAKIISVLVAYLFLGKYFLTLLKII